MDRELRAFVQELGVTVPPSTPRLPHASSGFTTAFAARRMKPPASLSNSTVIGLAPHTPKTAMR